MTKLEAIILLSTFDMGLFYLLISGTMTLPVMIVALGMQFSMALSLEAPPIIQEMPPPVISDSLGVDSMVVITLEKATG